MNILVLTISPPCNTMYYKGAIQMISLRLNDRDESLVKNYAALMGISVSELIRKSVIERIEDEIDLNTYNEAMAEYKKNPVRYTHKAVKSLIGL